MGNKYWLLDGYCWSATRRYSQFWKSEPVSSTGVLLQARSVPPWIIIIIILVTDVSGPHCQALCALWQAGDSGMWGKEGDNSLSNVWPGSRVRVRAVLLTKTESSNSGVSLVTGVAPCHAAVYTVAYNRTDRIPISNSNTHFLPLWRRAHDLAKFWWSFPIALKYSWETARVCGASI